MATGVTGVDVASFNANFNLGQMEVIAQNIRAFEQAGGALRLVDSRLKGDFSRNVVRRRIANPISRRDPASTAAATGIPARATSDTGVKVKRTYGPVENTKDAWYEMLADAGGDVDQLAFDYGQNAAEEQRKDQINSALRAGVAALSNQADVTHVVPADGSLNTSGLIRGASQFGDAFMNEIVAWIGHSKAWFDLIEDQVVNLQTTGISDFALATASPRTMLKPFIVTDSPALSATSGGSSPTTDYFTLGLTADAIRIMNSRPLDVAIDEITGLNNLIVRIQGEYDYNIECKGFQWDETNGGANPTDAAVATGSNWEPTGTDKKHFAGFVIQSR